MWEHHESQHGKEEEEGIEKETERSRATTTGEIQPPKGSLDKFKGFRVGTQEKHERAVKTVLRFQEDVHRLYVLLFFRLYFL